MFKKLFLSLTSATLGFLGCQGQIPQQRAHCANPEFDKTVARWINFSVPTVSPTEVKQMKQVLLLDARERSEYDVSHLPNARFCGYNDFDKNSLKDIPRDQPIVVYCSIGYRSEKIGEKLQKMGFTKVYNLYGSIFEWVNQGLPVVNNLNQPVPQVHTYNRSWSKWVDNTKIQKVW